MLRSYRFCVQLRLPVESFLENSLPEYRVPHCQPTIRRVRNFPSRWHCVVQGSRQISHLVRRQIEPNEGLRSILHGAEEVFHEPPPRWRSEDYPSVFVLLRLACPAWRPYRSLEERLA